MRAHRPDRTSLRGQVVEPVGQRRLEDHGTAAGVSAVSGVRCRRTRAAAQAPSSADSSDCSDRVGPRAAWSPRRPRARHQRRASGLHQHGTVLVLVGGAGSGPPPGPAAVRPPRGRSARRVPPDPRSQRDDAVAGCGRPRRDGGRWSRGPRRRTSSCSSWCSGAADGWGARLVRPRRCPAVRTERSTCPPARDRGHVAGPERLTETEARVGACPRRGRPPDACAAAYASVKGSVNGSVKGSVNSSVKGSVNGSERAPR